MRGDHDLRRILSVQGLDDRLPLQIVQAPRHAVIRHPLDLVELGEDGLRIDPVAQHAVRQLHQLIGEGVADPVAADRHPVRVTADADTGYGNAINVIRTVREYEKSGVAGFHIEDQVSPKKCGHYEGKEVISRAEMVGKIKCAVDTRRDAEMVIIARSDARAIEGLEAAIDRVNAYLEAGADVGFVEAPQT